MAADKEKLYETLGELIFIIAQADGVIQDEELAALDDILASHPWAATISWSFNYEMAKNKDVDDLYKKVIDACHSYGPTPEFDEFIEVMNVIATSSEGIDNHEKKVISDFSKDLIERFINDTEKLRPV